jgi:hypothetical protein
MFGPQKICQPCCAVYLGIQTYVCVKIYEIYVSICVLNYISRLAADAYVEIGVDSCLDEEFL